MSKETNKTAADLIADWNTRHPEIYFDREGRPLTTDQWIAKFEDAQARGEDYRRVAEDTVGPYWVSTVWLGINHNYGPHGPPLIFQTMIFPWDEATKRPKKMSELCMWRYATEGEASYAHKRIVEHLRELVDGKATEGDVMAAMQDFDP